MSYANALSPSLSGNRSSDICLRNIPATTLRKRRHRRPKRQPEKLIYVYSLDNVTVVKSIFQIFMDDPLQEVLPLLEQLMTDNDRHKQRAAAEVIGGECMSETLASTMSDGLYLQVCCAASSTGHLQSNRLFTIG